MKITAPSGKTRKTSKNSCTVELGPQRRCHVVGIVGIQAINPWEAMLKTSAAVALTQTDRPWPRGPQRRTA